MTRCFFIQQYDKRRARGVWQQITMRQREPTATSHHNAVLLVCGFSSRSFTHTRSFRLARAARVLHRHLISFCLAQELSGRRETRDGRRETRDGRRASTWFLARLVYVMVLQRSER